MDELERAFNAAVDRWVELLDGQCQAASASQAVLSEEDLLRRRAEVFRRPPEFDGVRGADLVWGWKCFRHWHPWLSIVGPVAVSAAFINAAWGLVAHLVSA